jgi:SAM-dependent methyltransferase
MTSEQPTNAKAVREALREKRKKRSDGLSSKLRDMPTQVSSPFFYDLQRRWPEPPTMAEPISQMCTAAQFAEPDYQRLCDHMKSKPRLHRKQWEFIYIARCLELSGKLEAGCSGLGFGVGREKLVSYFAARGPAIVATDLPASEAEGHWVGGLQHTDTAEKLFQPHIIDRESFDARVAFRPANMNSIPADLKGFDFTWSSCALEHLGSLQKGLDFIRNSVNCLKPGGVAIHTTEFNLHSAMETFVDGPSVVYRESDLLSFATNMRADGHSIELNFNPGNEPQDLMVDRDRNSDIHLRLYARHKFLATSVGLFIRKGYS